MKISKLGIEGAWLIEFPVYADTRGNFNEWFRRDEIRKETGFDFVVNQSNFSKSKLGTARGIHYSLAKTGQAKLITCLQGKILDFVIDLRISSINFKKWVSVELSGSSGHSILIGPHLGHAFLSLEEDSLVSYLLNSEYSPNNEFVINLFDSDIGLSTFNENLILSKKDAEALSLQKQKDLGNLPN